MIGGIFGLTQVLGIQINDWWYFSLTQELGIQINDWWYIWSYAGIRNTNQSLVVYLVLPRN